MVNFLDNLRIERNPESSNQHGEEIIRRYEHEEIYQEDREENEVVQLNTQIHVQQEM